MKKLIASVAVVTFLFSSSVFAQEVKEEKKAKTEKTCSKGDKKACTEKKACCTKKAEKKA